MEISKFEKNLTEYITGVTETITLPKMTAAKLRLARAAMGHPETKIGPLCKELGVTRQTLYRHVCPKGKIRPDGEKLLGKA